VNLLEIEALRVSYPTQNGVLHAVDGVDLAIAEGGTLGLVGESGSGKSSLAKAVVGLAPVSGGRVRFRGEDVLGRSGEGMRRLRKSVQMVFQDPYASLNPRMTVGDAIEEPMRIHFDRPGVERRREVARLLKLVGLPAQAAELYPFQFSGGQRQRVAIARALAVEPDLLVADEVTSALDVSVQAAILNLLRELRAATGVACLLITHNLAVVRYLASEIAVMHRGSIVEVGPADEVLGRPSASYTKLLIESAPRLRRVAPG
jgi:ABC-type glutathione transport system ATPase component